MIPGSAVIKFLVDLIDIHNPKDEVDITVLVPPSEDCKRKAESGDYVSYIYSLVLMDGTVIQEKYICKTKKICTLT